MKTLSFKPQPLQIGAIVIVGCLLIVAAVFGILPRPGSAFRVDVVVSTANQLREGSAVRLAGIDIGQVDEVGAGPDGTARLTLRIDEETDRLRKDATAAVVPRLLLEGNATIDISPGTPQAPPLESGDTIGLVRTSVAVQLDQVLGTLEGPVRENLTVAVGELAWALDSSADGGTSGADGLRQAARNLDASLGRVRRVSRAVQGQARNDLEKAVGATGATSAQLSADPRALAEIVTNYNRVLAALADNDVALAESVGEFDQLLTRAPAQLQSIDLALPRVEELADSLGPSLDRLPASLDSGKAALRQLNRLVGPSELPALMDDVEPAVTSLPTASSRLADLLRALTPVSRCLDRNVVGTLNMHIDDPGFTSGRPVWQELLHFGAMLTLFSTSFDGNGTALRAGTSTGEAPLVSQLPGGTPIYGSGDVVGRAPVPLDDPDDLQYRPDQPCAEQPLPNLSLRQSGEPPPGISRGTASEPDPGHEALRQAFAAKDRNAIVAALRELVGGGLPRIGDRGIDRGKLPSAGRPAPGSPGRPGSRGPNLPGRDGKPSLPGLKLPGIPLEDLRSLGDGVGGLR